MACQIPLGSDREQRFNVPSKTQYISRSTTDCAPVWLLQTHQHHRVELLEFAACLLMHLLRWYKIREPIYIFQAERVSTAIFHSGWDLIGAKQDLRTLIVVALVRSQSSITMTAFGIITLSYANFISVSWIRNFIFSPFEQSQGEFRPSVLRSIFVYVTTRPMWSRCSLRAFVAQCEYSCSLWLFVNHCEDSTTRDSLWANSSSLFASHK